MSPVPFEVQDEALDGEGAIHALTVRGELDLNTAPELEEPLGKALAEERDASILIDLTECEFIDSTGIAVIVRAWQRLDRDGGEGRGRLVLSCNNHQVQRVLKITGVEASISMYLSREDALAELRS